MGTYSDFNHSLPFLSENDIAKAQSINEATASALKDKFKKGYKGILYGGFIATAEGIKLIEYNARFGDPEAMNVLSLLDTDIIEVFEHIVNGTLKSLKIQFRKKATVCKYAVPEGYPDNPVKGKPIDISRVTDPDSLFLASVNIKDNSLVEAGSRAVACIGVADTLEEAESIAEKEISLVSGPLFHRKDIGTTDFIQSKIDSMNSLR
jgi:fusion protein PurCD